MEIHSNDGQQQRIFPHGDLTTLASFAGHAKVKYRQDMASVCLPFSRDDVGKAVDSDKTIAILSVIKPKVPTVQASRVICMLCKVWFKEGAFALRIDGASPVRYRLDPARGRKIHPMDWTMPCTPGMGIPLMPLPPVEEGSEIEMTLELRGVEPLTLNDTGSCSGSGSAFVWPLQKTSPMVEKMRESFKFNDMDFTDFRLVCEGKEIKCHKFMLAAMSPVFKRYLVNDSMEARQGFINIEDAEPDAVGRMVKFMYTETINIDIKSDYVVDDLSQLLQLSEKYDIPSLSQKCCEMILCFMKEENASDVLRLARMLNLKELETTAQNYVASRAKKVIQTEAWNELLVDDPMIANNIIEKLVQQ